AATSTCRLPRPNISAARIRRAASPAKSRRARPRLVADQETAGTPPLSYPGKHHARNDSLYFRKIFNGGLLESGKVPGKAAFVRGGGRSSAQVKGRRSGIDAPLSTNYR